MKILITLRYYILARPTFYLHSVSLLDRYSFMTDHRTRWPVCVSTLPYSKHHHAVMSAFSSNSIHSFHRPYICWHTQL